jgi:primosomal protein N' (replication factor Y)
MPDPVFAYCDVALPVPLDRVFTYALGGRSATVGARVIVPFRNEKLLGVIVRVHDEAPKDGEKLVEAKPVESVVDDEPILSEHLLELGRWLAGYYLAPLGEVLRSMLPLTAEVRKQVLFRITDMGRDLLAASFDGHNPQGSKRGTRTREEQELELRVLEHLKAGAAIKLTTLRTATTATQQVLQSMLRKKLIARETAAQSREARRTVRFAVLVEGIRLPKLTANQQGILAELAANSGELPLEAIRELPVPPSTLATLVRRELVRIEERDAEFHVSRLPVNRHGQELNPAQVKALEAITAQFGGFKTLLLHGITGSGKTAVYLAAMQEALDRGLASILLVPEIGLTPAMAAQLHAAFGRDVALLHSALTPEERAEQWHRIRRGEAPIVVGTRSAVFAPVPKLGLILVDEEHDQSYKQEEMPRYHARDVAVMRAKLAGAVAVLGSATPSLESWHNTELGRYQRIQILDRVMDRPLPTVELVDMRREFQETGKEELFSRALVAETQATLDRNEQVMILLNRRGYSFVVMCRSCGLKLECENCAISLTRHKPMENEDWVAHPGERLECHYCGFRRTVPARCPECDSEYLFFLGAGSQQGEEKLLELFPGARIGRMDRDTVRGRHDMERLLTRLHSGEINLLVGTQMIAKGHDIHGVTLVGVVGCDHALSMPDFRAAERVFQLLTQVSGRAGRGDLPGKVIVQTYHPDHYSVISAAHHDYEAFMMQEMRFRRDLHYPPYGVLANVLLQSIDLAEVSAWAMEIGRWVQNTEHKGVRILGPATAPIARIKRTYRFHLVLKAMNRSDLRATLVALLTYAESKGIPRRNLIADVDAINLM